MERNHMIVATVVVCIANGMLSPALFTVAVLWPAWFPTLVVPATGNFILFLSSLIVSTATLLVSAVGAAVYERIAGQKDSTTASMAVWLTGAALLTVPGVQKLF